MSAMVSRARPVRIEPVSGIFRRRDASARSTPSSAGELARISGIELREQTDERVRWTIALASMAAFPVAGAMSGFGGARSFST